MKRVLLMLLVLLTWFAPLARADVVVSPDIAREGDVFRYTYSVTNAGTVPIFSYEMSVRATISELTTPDGWIVNTSPFFDGTIIGWTASDLGFDVPAGETFSGFGFTSRGTPGNVLFTALDEDFREFRGFTDGPSAEAVPEPASVALLSIGLTAVGAAIRKRRRRQASH